MGYLVQILGVHMNEICNPNSIAPFANIVVPSVSGEILFDFIQTLGFILIASLNNFRTFGWVDNIVGISHTT